MKLLNSGNKYLLILLVSFCIFNLHSGLNAVDSAFAATYNFDQTSVIGEVKGTITIQDGTFTDQAAADELNASIYSITVISGDGQNSVTLTQDNSTWTWHSHEGGYVSVYLSADGDTLQLKLIIDVDAYYGGWEWLEVMEDEPASCYPRSRFEFVFNRDWDWYDVFVARWGTLVDYSTCFDGYALFSNQDLWAETLPLPYSNEVVYSFPALTPMEQLEEIMGAFEESVEDGTLEGSGPANSAQGRLGALWNMLEQAEYYINNGQISEACQQLLDVYKRIDGDPRPPDFVKGDAAYMFELLVEDLRNSLECP